MIAVRSYDVGLGKTSEEIQPYRKSCKNFSARFFIFRSSIACHLQYITLSSSSRLYLDTFSLYRLIVPSYWVLLTCYRQKKFRSCHLDFHFKVKFEAEKISFLKSLHKSWIDSEVQPNDHPICQAFLPYSHLCFLSGKLTAYMFFLLGIPG